MINKELTCIGCPMGCTLEIAIDGEKIVKITGNTCKIGEEYGKKECTNPTRIVTSSVSVNNGNETMVSVKTEKDIPKSKVFECVRILRDLVVEAPIKIGDVLYKDIASTGVNIVATKNIDKK